MNGHHEVAVYLLDRGAEVYIQNKKGHTILLSIAQAKTEKQKEMFCLIYDGIQKGPNTLKISCFGMSDHGFFHLLTWDTRSKMSVC